MAIEPVRLAQQLLGEVAPGQEHPYDECILWTLGDEVRRTWVLNLHAPLSQVLEAIQQDREAHLALAALHGANGTTGAAAFEQLATGLLETAHLPGSDLTDDDRRHVIEVNPELLLGDLSEGALNTVYAALAYIGLVGLIETGGWLTPET